MSLCPAGVGWGGGALLGQAGASLLQPRGLEREAAHAYLLDARVALPVARRHGVALDLERRGLARARCLLPRQRVVRALRAPCEGVVDRGGARHVGRRRAVVVLARLAAHGREKLLLEPFERL